MDSLEEDKPEPLHGTVATFRNGVRQVHSLCACHPDEVGELSHENLGTKLYLDHLEGKIKILESQSMISGRNIHNIEDQLIEIKETLKETSQTAKDASLDVKNGLETLLKIQEQDRLNFDKNFNQIRKEVEKVTLWSLIKKCFSK